MLEAITYTSTLDIRIINVYPVNSVHYTIFKEVWTGLLIIILSILYSPSNL
jgi:hypothetical protein